MTSTPVYLLDTNLIVRLLTNDTPALAQATRRTFDEAAAGRLALDATPTIVAEACFVLDSVYELPRQSVADGVREVLALPGVRVRESAVIGRAFDLFLAHRKLKWVDAYLLSLAEAEAVGVASLDRPLARAAPPGVAVLDPSRA